MFLTLFCVKVYIHSIYKSTLPRYYHGFTLTLPVFLAVCTLYFLYGIKVTRHGLLPKIGHKGKSFLRNEQIFKKKKLHSEDMKVYHGNIVTVDEKNSIYQYLVEDKGRIAYVGDELPKECANTEVIELGKKALVPSFVDTHQHFASFAIFHSGLNVMDFTSNKEMLEAIKDYVGKAKEKTNNNGSFSSYGVVDYHSGKVLIPADYSSIVKSENYLFAKDAFGYGHPQNGASIAVCPG